MLICLVPGGCIYYSYVFTSVHNITCKHNIPIVVESAISGTLNSIFSPCKCGLALGNSQALTCHNIISGIVQWLCHHKWQPDSHQHSTLPGMEIAPFDSACCPPTFLLISCDLQRISLQIAGRLWQIIPRKSPIFLFSDIEPIIISKVAYYSQIITLNSEHTVCSSCVQYKNDVRFLI